MSVGLYRIYAIFNLGLHLSLAPQQDQLAPAQHPRHKQALLPLRLSRAIAILQRLVDKLISLVGSCHLRSTFRLESANYGTREVRRLTMAARTSATSLPHP